MTPDELLEPRDIVSMQLCDDGVGYDVNLSCGHTVVFVVEPPMDRFMCAECVQMALDLAKREKARRANESDRRSTAGGRGQGLV